jgi:hypothetical protein
MNVFDLKGKPPEFYFGVSHRKYLLLSDRKDIRGNIFSSIK